MGFEASPVLPDYSKLIFKLNSGGIQQWNPPVYEVLKALIEAVQQSQQVFQSTIIPAALPAAFSGVTVQDPISGDGFATPLGAKYDNTTIGLNGSGQLTALIGLQIYQAKRTFTEGEIRSLNTAPITVINHVANKLILPFASFWYVNQVAGFNVASSGSLQYSSNVSNKAISGNFSISFGAGTGKLYGPRGYAGANNFDPAGGDGDPAADNIILKASTDVTGGAGNSGLLYVTYALVDFP